MRLASPIVILAGLALFATTGICSAAEDADSAPAFEAQIGRHGRPIVVDVELADRGTVQFMLDTGAATTAFDATLMDIASQRIGTRRIQTAKGEVQLDTYSCPQAKVGPFDLQGVDEVVFVDLTGIRAATGYEIKGVLGIDFLGHFAIEVDFDGGALRMWEAAPWNGSASGPSPSFTYEVRRMSSAYCQAADGSHLLSIPALMIPLSVTEYSTHWRVNRALRSSRLAALRRPQGMHAI
jgi:hypothetical protein